MRRRNNCLVLATDASGQLVSSALEKQRKRRRIRLARPTGVHLRMIRYVIIAVDVTRHMDIKPFEGGMRPSSLVVATRALARFVRMFLDANPLCRVAIHRTGHEGHGNSAERVEDFSSNAAILEARLHEMGSTVPPKRGGISLQNVLTLARKSFEGVPSYAAKELLFVHSALTTRDAGDVHNCIEQVRAAGIRCSVISLSAQVRVFELAAERTHGLFDVAEDEPSLRRILERHVVPAPEVRGRVGDAGDATAPPAARFIEMGFPTFEEGLGTRPKPATSRIHGTHENRFKFSTSGYTCPRCRTFVLPGGLSLPCPTCNLLLSASKDLARSCVCLSRADLRVSRAAALCSLTPPPPLILLRITPTRIAPCAGTTHGCPSAAPRSYHHLFPVAPFEELHVARCVQLATAGCTACFGCDRELLRPWRAGASATGEWQGEVWLRCPRCGPPPGLPADGATARGEAGARGEDGAGAIVFCDACDVFIHDSLHNCPGCATYK
jgi:transcription initiation factor TFIIH subunit 2